jgi:DNA-binding XRE family transcriptional regulator
MSERLEELRFNAGLSPEELGIKVHVSGRTIRRIEDGATKPTPRVAKKLADHFGVTASELFPRDPAPTSEVAS